MDHNKWVNLIMRSYPASMSFSKEGEGAVNLRTKGSNVMNTTQLMHQIKEGRKRNRSGAHADKAGFSRVISWGGVKEFLKVFQQVGCL